MKTIEVVRAELESMGHSFFVHAFNDGAYLSKNWFPCPFNSSDDRWIGLYETWAEIYSRLETVIRIEYSDPDLFEKLLPYAFDFGTLPPVFWNANSSV